MADSADDPLLREIDDELRQEKYLQLWRQYGTYFVAVVVAVVVGVAGYQGWRSYSEQARQAAGEEFNRVLQLAHSNQFDSAAQALAKLDDKGDTSYGLLARFEQASIASRKGDRAAAVTLYQTIADDGGVDSVYRELATLLGAIEAMDSADPAALIQRLAPLTSTGNPWRFSAREVTGMLAFRKGDHDQAQSLFRGLVNDGAAPQGVRERSAAMLGVLGSQTQEG